MYTTEYAGVPSISKGREGGDSSRPEMTGFGRETWKLVNTW